VRVDAIEGGDAPRVQLAGGHIVHAGAVVDATNASITSRYDLPLRQAAYRSYVIGLELAAETVPHALFWDTEEPYHYLRVVRDASAREILLIGGEDHRTGQGEPEACFAWLEAWARARFPAAGEIATRWSGQIMEPADALGYIGAARDLANVYVVSGDSGNGLTNGALAGLLLPALIRREAHPWAARYAPMRSRAHGAGTLLQEAAHSTAPYTDWVSPSAPVSLSVVPAGEGRVLRHGAHRIAAYRDRSGACHLRSARCPHLHAVVRWNPLEKSWDCPAHGSRFDPCGHAVNSPTARDLPELAADLEAEVRAADDMASTSRVRIARQIAAGAACLAVGLWPVVHVRSFAAVTGLHRTWPFRLLGAALAVTGAALLIRDRR
jgi:nitrite reductase/ring-hydroxylating ferredoxin subunit